VTVETDASIWEISSDTHRASIIRRQGDFQRFREIAHRTFDEIQNRRICDVDLPVFPSTPVTCSVEIGRVWQPGAQPSFDVFDRTQEQGFVRHLVVTRAGAPIFRST